MQKNKKLNQQKLCDGAANLGKIEPRFAFALSKTGLPALRVRPEGFQTLLSAIVSQQVSVAAAKAIWARVCKAGLDCPKQIISANDEEMRAVGLSKPKIRYARALAVADLDYDGFSKMDDDAVIAELTTVLGIGVWTAQIYVMFSLARADVFPSGDLALQEAVKGLFHLENRPKDKELAVMAQKWSPYKSIAALQLWAYYSEMKRREGIAL